MAFESTAANLVSNDTNGVSDIFVYDRQTGQTTRVSVDYNGTEANEASTNPSISSNGRYIAFSSTATNLVNGDTNGTQDPLKGIDVFVHDRQTGQTTRVSVDSNGAEANEASTNPSISSDGQVVAFESKASNLVTSDGNGVADVFTRNRQTNQTTRISVDSNGAEGNGSSTNPAISADGLVVSFASVATNLFGNDANSVSDVFARDLQTGKTKRVSSGQYSEANGGSTSSAVSSNGDTIAFGSNASNLAMTTDNNSALDIFVSSNIVAGKAYLERTEDRNGNALTYTYPTDPSARGPDSITDGLGRQLNFTYGVVGTTDTNPYLTQITDQAGRSVTFGYTEDTQESVIFLSSITDPMGNATTFQYDSGHPAVGANGFLTSKTMPLGNAPYTQTL